MKTIKSRTQRIKPRIVKPNANATLAYKIQEFEIKNGVLKTEKGHSTYYYTNPKYFTYAYKIFIACDAAGVNQKLNLKSCFEFIGDLISARTKNQEFFDGIMPPSQVLMYYDFDSDIYNVLYKLQYKDGVWVNHVRFGRVLIHYYVAHYWEGAIAPPFEVRPLDTKESATHVLMTRTEYLGLQKAKEWK